MNKLFAAPLLAALLPWTGQVMPPVHPDAASAATSRTSPPALVPAGLVVAHAAEAGTVPQLGTRGDISHPRAAGAASADRSGGIPRTTTAVPVGGPGAGADRSPLYFGSLPPPARAR